MQRLNLISILGSLLFTVACDGTAATPEVAEYWQGDLVDNGLNLNGINLNGLNLNGLNLNGLNLNGLNLNGLNLNGVELQKVSLEGSSLQGKPGSGGSLAADVQLVGAQLKGELSNSTTAAVRIDSVTWNEANHVYLYNASIRSDKGWSPLCGMANGAPVPAIPTAGQWNPTTGKHVDDDDSFTFACANAAIGKCLIWGYQSWATKQECKGNKCRDQPLDAWLQACTRMVRADYCGDGVAHTRNGTTIDVWDQLGIQNRATTSLRFEAEWAQDGAYCISHTRWVRADATSLQTDATYVRLNCPTRFGTSYDEGCGRSSDFTTDKGLDRSLSSRHLLRNESAMNQ